MSLESILKSAILDIQSNPRICSVCGEVETIHNVMFSYDCGQIMCDECAFIYYEGLED